MKKYYKSSFINKIPIQKTREELHQYWENPNDKDNTAELYLKNDGRSKFLAKIIKKYEKFPEASIIEIGCNVGRNLNHLHIAGYKKLCGIEISSKAVRLMKKNYPTFYKLANIYNLPVENVIRKFNVDQFDVVYTMAVLQHIHHDSEWIFEEMARIAKQYIITIEDEHGLTWRHFPRNYKTVFEKLHMVQIEQINCRHIKGLSKDFMARVFKKKQMDTI